MHFKEAKGILSPKNGMNLYRGCTHGCIYCDARSKCYNMQHDFEDVEVKSNALELLEKALLSKRNPCMIGTGAMTDSYMPIEKTLMYTRKSLELINKYGYGVAVQTKSDLILRDLDLLESIHHRTKCVVQMTLTTYDDALCKIVEPGVCKTKRRIEVLKIMNDLGIPTIVWLTPILPFINDTEENIHQIVDACIETKVYGILTFGMGLTLREGDREYYYEKLDAHFPRLKEKYIQTYGNAYNIPSPNSHKLMSILKSKCSKHNIVTNDGALFTYMQKFENKTNPPQLSMFDLL